MKQNSKILKHFKRNPEYGILGLATLALGYVGWIFIKRHLAEKDELKEKLLKETGKCLKRVGGGNAL